MLNINCEKKLNKSCQQEGVRLGVFSTELRCPYSGKHIMKLGKTPKRTPSCWQLLFNFYPQLIFNIFKVLKQNLGCGCKNSIRY